MNLNLTYCSVMNEVCRSTALSLKFNMCKWISICFWLTEINHGWCGRSVYLMNRAPNNLRIFISQHTWFSNRIITKKRLLILLIGSLVIVSGNLERSNWRIFFVLKNRPPFFWFLDRWILRYFHKCSMENYY